MHLIVEEAGRNRPSRARNDRDVEQLAYIAFQPDPFDDVAGSEVYDLHPAPGIGVALPELGIEFEPAEASITRQRQSHDGMAIVKSQTTQETRAKRARLECAACRINRAKVAGAGIQHPQPILEPAWRMRHR